MTLKEASPAERRARLRANDELKEWFRSKTGSDGAFNRLDRKLVFLVGLQLPAELDELNEAVLRTLVALNRLDSNSRRLLEIHGAEVDRFLSAAKQLARVTSECCDPDLPAPSRTARGNRSKIEYQIAEVVTHELDESFTSAQDKLEGYEECIYVYTGRRPGDAAKEMRRIRALWSRGGGLFGPPAKEMTTGQRARISETKRRLFNALAIDDARKAGKPARTN